MKYNSIGEQLIAKAKELDPNYKPDKFNDMSEAIDIILNNTGGDNYIDLVFSYQWFMDHINGYNLTIPANTITEDMLLQIAYNKKKGLLLKIQGPENGEIPNLIFLTITLELDMISGKLISNATNLGDQVGYWTLPLEDLSQDQVCKFNLIEKKIWYDLGTYSETITQDQYNEIKELIGNNSLAGVALQLQNVGYYHLISSTNDGIFTFRLIGVGSENTNGNTKRTIDTFDLIIKADLSVSFSWDSVPILLLTQDLSSQSIPSIKIDGYQQNLTIGDGLEIKGGALDVNRNGVFKTNTITISKSEISLSETENKQINFNTTAQEKITNLFTLINQNQNNIVSIKSIIKLIDGSSFIIYMDYHARSAINSENIQGIAISSAINNSFDLHMIKNSYWQSSADLTSYFNYIQEYEIVFCYF